MTRLPVLSLGQALSNRIDPQTQLAMLMQIANFQTQQEQARRASDTSDRRLDLILEMARGAQAGHDEARQANEKRRDEILEMSGLLRNRVLGDLEQFGNSLITDANRQWDQSRNNQLADLAARGMPGSTARIAVENRNLEGRQRSLQRIGDMLTQNRVAADERLTGRVADFLERITDAYPAANNNLEQLAMSLGQMAGDSIGGGFTPQPFLPQLPFAPQLPAGGAAGGGGGGATQRSLQSRPGVPAAPAAPTSPIRTIAPNPAQQAGLADQQRRDFVAQLTAAMQPQQAGQHGITPATNALQLRGIREGHLNPVMGQLLPTVPGASPNIVGGPGVEDSTDPFLQQLVGYLIQQRGAAGGAPAAGSPAAGSPAAGNGGYITNRTAAARARSQHRNALDQRRRGYTTNINRQRRDLLNRASMFSQLPMGSTTTWHPTTWDRPPFPSTALFGN